ncbi:non-ribosomal peptide synthetase [Beggiatoa leptomitoformis]|nr:amino acid adenylation domain-containing protein [Beggiatoa leptomitoformis]
MNNHSSNLALCVHELFAEQVRYRPHATAVVFAEQQLSYIALDQQANQLAHYLQQKGVVADTIVGICVERSLEMVVCVLAVLKAGGAYLLLDPETPSERLAFMLVDVNAMLLLTDESVAPLLPVHQSTLVYIDHEASAIRQLPNTPPDVTVQPDNLSYIIYTSGSTGKPKGVLLTHRGLCNLVTVTPAILQLDADSRVLQFFSANSDGATYELFLTLCNGATLYLLPSKAVMLGTDFAYRLRDQAITHLQITPSVLNTLPILELPDLKMLLVVGEVCPSALVERWGKNRLFFNGYGLSETTVCATLMQCTDPNSPPSIGCPIPNTHVYMLDEQCQPVPMGEIGEMYVGGLNVARGYLNRPELTAERFIPDPFAQTDTRLYKTGDMGRYLADGNIEFLGRIDNQVKVRGFRVELDEIESVLAQHPLVQQASVVVNAHQEMDKRLVAYVVPQTIQSSEYLSTWQALNEQTYQQYNDVDVQKMTLTGWNSSYTGEAFSEAEMLESIEQIVARVLALKPQHVLEIGCGAGLLLTRIAPHCQSYIGADYSATAIAYVEKLRRTIGGLENVTLLHRSADNFTDLAPASQDVILINSVIQSFPDTDYLLTVVTGALKLLRAGGALIIGDVVNYNLQEIYHASLQAYQADAQLTPERLLQKIQQSKVQKKELSVSPSFFIVLQNAYPQIQHVQVMPRDGRHLNESTQFRYDVLLHVGEALLPRAIPHWLTWEEQPLSLAEIEKLLTQEAPPLFGIRGITNARLHTPLQQWQWLQEYAQPHQTVAELHTFVSQQVQQGINPADLWHLTKKIPYHVEISWLNSGVQGHFDVVFTHQTMNAVPAIFERPLVMDKLWSLYTNNPAQAKQHRQLAGDLRRFLRAKLPHYMMPSAFVMLADFPLTPTGKVDRQSLAKLPVHYPVTLTETARPRNAVEQVLADTWADVLGLESVGIHDNFFALGGDSLNAMLLFLKLQTQFKQDFRLADLFNAPTIAEFVAYLPQQPLHQTTVQDTAWETGEI